MRANVCAIFPSGRGSAISKKRAARIASEVQADFRLVEPRLELSDSISRLSVGIALAVRTLKEDPAAGSYQATLASMAKESARKHKKNAMILRGCGLAMAGEPSIAKF